MIFSWELLRDKGRPNYRTYYVKVTRAQAIGARSVRFDLSGADDRELPLILGLMPVLAKHAINPDTFEDTSFEPLLGSGPYTVAAVKPGESVTFKRDPNYWGRELPINRGLWNFDQIKFDYYRDGNTHFEAFKKGNYDVRSETDPGRWQTAYDFPALREGRVVKEEFSYGLPKGMQGLVFNTRRPIFADVRVREALLHLFDFEWINRTYFFSLYKRTASYFDGCDLSAHGVPANARERELLAPFPGSVRDDIMAGAWTPPVSDGSGGDRAGLRKAFALFAEAGYALKGTELVHRASGRPFTFEILTTTRDQDRLALAFVRNLKRAGIDARVRSVDATQFERRRIAFDFDMMDYRWEQSLSPGNEQYFYWGSEAATQDGTRNYMGVQSKAVDAMIAAMLSATSRDDFVAATRALDRVLLSGFYVIPLYFPPKQWVARWTRIRASLSHLTVRLFAGNVVARGRAMILGEILGDTQRDAAGDGTTLDDLFRRAGVRRPEALALIDPPNRESFTDGAPRSLSYAQADRAIASFAAYLRRLGLATDTVVALQLPNTVEGVIALWASCARA